MELTEYVAIETGGFTARLTQEMIICAYSLKELIVEKLTSGLMHDSSILTRTVEITIMDDPFRSEFVIEVRYLRSRQKKFLTYEDMGYLREVVSRTMDPAW